MFRKINAIFCSNLNEPLRATETEDLLHKYPDDTPHSRATTEEALLLLPTVLLSTGYKEQAWKRISVGKFYGPDVPGLRLMSPSLPHGSTSSSVAEELFRNSVQETFRVVGNIS
uniref:Uncharacterized protein n=1 Tax=Sphaerodactylus townsendi TaxID=933632 RepID=A0ACB8G8X5_9SAUR